jgi:hypothetical protein
MRSGGSTHRGHVRPRQDAIESIPFNLQYVVGWLFLWANQIKIRFVLLSRLLARAMVLSVPFFFLLFSWMLLLIGMNRLMFGGWHTPYIGLLQWCTHRLMPIRNNPMSHFINTIREALTNQIQNYYQTTTRVVVFLQNNFTFTREAAPRAGALLRARALPNRS